MAGNIDSLNFKVILNDDQFRTTVEKDISLAKKLNTSLTDILNTKKKINAGAKSSFLDEQKMAQAAAKTAQAKAKEALEWQKVRTEAEKTAFAQQKVKASIEKSAGAFTGGGNSLTRVWLRFYATMWSVISAVRLFAKTIGSAIKKISEFQQANANLATIMQVSRKEIGVLTNDALMLGRTTEWTASQVTELQTALAKLGYNIPQIRNMQASVLQFATAVGATLPDAANLAGASLRMFGLHSSEMQKSLEILTASTNKTALDFEKLKVALPYVGAIAHSIGFDLADASSLLGVLANSGLSASRTGTGLRKVLLELSKDNGKLQTAMGGNIKTFDEFVNGLRGLRDRGLEAGEAQKLVGDRAGSALLILANGVDDIQRLNDEVRDTSGLLKDIQSERLNTLHGSVLLLKSAWEGLIQTFRDSAGPMKDIVDWLTEIVRATSLAASRANRVAQGTKDVIGSDELTKKYKQRYDALLGDGTKPEEAARIVQDEMRKWLDGAYKDLAELQKKGYKENGWNTFLYGNPITHFMVSGKMNKGRAANEQVEAMENTMDAVNDYIANRAKEDAEIAANEYLDKFTSIFDEKGEKAARTAMASLEKEMIDKGVDVSKIKQRVDAYIAEGGENGARDRGKAPTAAQIQNEAISDLKARAQYIRKLADDYEKLEQYLGEGTNDKMVEIFGDGDYSRESIEKQIQEIIASLRDLGDEGVDAANALEQAWGFDLFSKTLKQLEADNKEVEKYKKGIEEVQKELRRWEKDWGGNYSGFNGDVEKAFFKYTNENKEIDEEYNEALKKAAEVYKDDAEGLKNYTDELERYYRVRKAANFNAGQSAIDDLAAKYVKRATSGLSLKDWGDKSVMQVFDIWKILSKMADSALLGDLDIDENLTAEIEKAGFTLEDFAKLSHDEFKKLSKEAKEELLKKVGNVVKEVAGDFRDAASSVRNFAEASGNMNLAASVDELISVGDAISSIASRALNGDWVGAVTAGISAVIKSIFAEKAAVAELEAKLASAREEARVNWLNNSLSSGVSSIFGDDDLRKAQDAIENISKLRMSMSKYSGDVASMKFNGRKWGFWEGFWNSTERAIKGEKYHQEYIVDLAKSVGGELYDAYGNLNADTLQAILETYENLDSEQREWIEHAINDSKAYSDAMEQIDSVIESIFGDMAGSVADKIVDSWWEAGQAALDYADILDDVAKSYAKLLVNQLLLDNAFDEHTQETLKEAFRNGDAAGAMRIVAEAMERAEQMLPVAESALEAFEPYINRNVESSSSSNSVGSGIKSITEDTANLLASYINAIRDDVSNIRRMQETGWESINLLGTSVPTLNEYLAQIAATNFDIAQSNQSILSEIQSVIGAPGTSGMVVRVEYA